MHEHTHAQQSDISRSTLRNKRIAANAASVVFDTLPVVPGSFFLDDALRFPLYHIIWADARLVWKQFPPEIRDSITIHYRVFQSRPDMMISRRNYDDYRFHFFAAPVSEKTAPNTINPFADLQSLQTDGSIGRSLQLGSNQDVVLNSSMNLQMKGYIGDSLELQAMISDNNLPIQPEGNTQDLRDLDRIFLQIKKRNWQVNLGDLDMKSNQLHFLKFYKRIQGANYQFNSKITPSTSGITSVYGAIAKGKFNRNLLTTIEGNQGPYRLKGANNELYFIVLAGTERVFADGILLQRGADQDYVVNYNTAEITFTPRFLVSKDTRIQVEFEYADRNYLNTQMYLNHEMNIANKIKMEVGLFSNQDAKNTAIDQSLDFYKKNFLTTLGDSIQQAYYNDAFRDTPGEGKFLYKKMDTVYQNNLRDSIYVFSNNPNDELYALNFTFVGQGKGNYRQVVNATNGKIYQWIAPTANLIKQGDYEPVVLLVTPKSQQIITLAAQFNPSSHSSFSTSLALSRNDINLFASKQKQNDLGFAGHIRLKQQLATFKISGIAHQLHVESGWERLSSTFRTVERFRNVEFLRDWSLPPITNTVKESLGDLNVKLVGKEKNILQFGLISYNRDDGYKGFSNRYIQHYEDASWKLDASLSWLKFQYQNTNGSFTRPTIDLKKTLASLGGAVFSVQALAEINQVKSGLDSITPNSFAFARFETALQTPTEKELRWGVKYFTRKDWKPQTDKLAEADQSHNFSASVSYTGNPKHLITVSSGWRKLDILNSTLSGEKADQAIVGQLDYGFKWLKDVVTGTCYYELGGGQEPKRDFSYVAVPVGQGNYTWIDYNGNGVEELNEFELALYPDQKKYIRIQVPGTQFTRVNALQFNYNLDISPIAWTGGQTKRWKWLQQCSANSSMQINRKQLASAGLVFDPGFAEIPDSSLVSTSLISSHTLFINRLSIRWGVDVVLNQNRNKSLYIYGFEDRKINDSYIKGRWNINQSWVWTAGVNSGEKALQTTGAKFENRNYQIRKNQLETSMTYLYKNIFRASLSGERGFLENKIDSLEKLNAYSIQAELKYNILSTTSIGLRWNLRQLSFQAYEGADKTPVGFVLLDGLQPGSNQLWSVDILKRVSKNMELNLQYEGRKLAGGNLIHSGRASIRAIF
jgi:hypothetical protein